MHSAACMCRSVCLLAVNQDGGVSLAMAVGDHIENVTFLLRNATVRRNTAKC